MNIQEDFDNDQKKLYKTVYDENIKKGKTEIFSKVYAECIADNIGEEYAGYYATYSELFYNKLDKIKYNDDEIKVIIGNLSVLCVKEHDPYDDSHETDESVFIGIFDLWKYSENNLQLENLDEKLLFVEEMNEFRGNNFLYPEDKEKYQIYLDEAVSIVVGERLQNMYKGKDIYKCRDINYFFNEYLKLMEPYSQNFSDENKRNECFDKAKKIISET